MSSLVAFPACWFGRFSRLLVWWLFPPVGLVAFPASVQFGGFSRICPVWWLFPPLFGLVAFSYFTRIFYSPEITISPVVVLLLPLTLTPTPAPDIIMLPKPSLLSTLTFFAREVRIFHPSLFSLPFSNSCLKKRDGLELTSGMSLVIVRYLQSDLKCAINVIFSPSNF